MYQPSCSISPWSGVRLCRFLFTTGAAVKVDILFISASMGSLSERLSYSSDIARIPNVAFPTADIVMSVPELEN